MKNRHGVRYLESSYSSYHGRIHNKYADSKVCVFDGQRMPIDCVSAGHVVLGKPADSLKDEREQLKKAAKSY